MQLKFEMVLQDYCRKKKNHALLFKRTGDQFLPYSQCAGILVERSGLEV